MSGLDLLILNGDMPLFPGGAGNEYFITTRLAQYAGKVGLVSQVHTREQQQRAEGLTDAGISLYVWENPNLEQPTTRVDPPKLRRRIAMAIYDFLLAGWKSRPEDTIVEDRQFRNMSAPLLRALNEATWQSVIVIQSKCAHWLDYVPSFPASILVLHDVRALVYERRARTTRQLPGRLRWWMEAWRYRGFEGKYCRRFDLVVTVSPADEAWVRQHYKPKRLVTVPLPVDTEYFVPMSDVHVTSSRIVFTGMMNHPPNVDAARFFACEVFPRIRAIIPDAEFWIVGREPASEVRELANLPGVVVTGFVPDIRLHMAQATVFVVPLRFGSGMRNKILEAWGMQKCIVSTRIGAEGLNYQDGAEILIADDVETMAQGVIEVINDPRRREEMGIKGRALVCSQHQPEKLALDYYRSIATVVHEKHKSDEPMRVAIDLRWMHPGVAGGIENLSRSYLSQLVALDRHNRYALLVPSEVRYDLDLRGHSNFSVVAADGPQGEWRRLRQYGMRALHRKFRVDYWQSPEVETLQFAHDLKANVALSTSGYIRPDLYPLRNVLIVADLQHEYYPEFFSSEECQERIRVFGDSIRRADHLIAISDHTRQTVLERFDIEPARITTAHLAADPLFWPSNRRANRDEVLRKYNLTRGDYLFLPANTWPHKNHRAAFQALQLLREVHHLDPLLVCTGTAKEAHPTLLSLLGDLGLENRVKFLGYCPVEDMPALYEGAGALVYPSFFEGFGIPLLEAMWCDCPVVCSNVTSLPEIGGDAALLVDPKSPEQLAEAASRVLTDPELRQTLIKRGRDRAARFSWQTFTGEVTRILRQVHDRQYGIR